MERATVDGGNEGSVGRGTSKRALSDALGTTAVAVNHYRLSPGEGLPGGLHAHWDQEEVFVVLSGEATFDCLLAENEGESRTASTVVVRAGEAVRFAPGEFQSGRNEGEEPLELLALGAPRDTEDVRIPVKCRACGHADLRLDTGGELTFVCPVCGVQSVPRPCPDCGDEELRITLGDGGGTVVVCSGCGATYDRPPTDE